MTTRAQGRARGTVCVWCGEGREAERGRGEAPEDAPLRRAVESGHAVDAQATTLNGLRGVYTRTR